MQANVAQNSLKALIFRLKQTGLATLLPVKFQWPHIFANVWTQRQNLVTQAPIELCSQ